MKKRKIIGLALLASAAILFAALLGTAWRKTALAQMVSQTGPVIVVAGTPYSGTSERPLYLLDTSTQVLLVYTYNPQENWLRLCAARKVLADLSLTELANKPPSVKESRDKLDRERKK